jgi:hypothetical protein
LLLLLLLLLPQMLFLYARFKMERIGINGSLSGTVID